MKNLIIFARKRGGKSMADKVRLLKSWMLSTNKAVLTNVKKICTEWLKPTAHLLISDSNIL